MRMRTMVICVSLLLRLFTALAPAEAQTIDRNLDSYVILAIDEFAFKGGNEGTNTRGYVLGGNVGVNNPDPNIGDTQANLNVGANGLFVMSGNTQLVSGSIRLGVEASVWDVYVDPSGEKGSGWGATNPKIGGLTIRNSKYSISNATDLPIIDPALLTTEELCGPFEDYGTTDITVTTGSGGNSPLTLAPGPYQDIQVQNGATLHLQAGVYTVRRFTTGQNVNVYTVPGTIIHIWGDGDPNSRDFNLGGNGSYFGSEDPDVESVACICVSDEFNNNAGDANNNTIQFSDNGVFWGVIYAPGSSINLGRNFTHYGRFVGKTIGSDFNDNVTYKDCKPEPGQGTTLTAAKTALGHLGVEYTWQIYKSLKPSDGSPFNYATLDLFQGDSATVRYIIQVVRSAGVNTTAHVDGEICVTNTGQEATEGLQITDTVTDPLNNVMGTVNVDVSAKPVLLPGESYCYPYRVDFTNPGTADPATTYTNTATVSIDNFQSNGPVVATTTTLLTPAPVNGTIVVDDTNGGSWTFFATGNVRYDKTFTATQDCGVHTNRATIRDTGQFAEATVQVNCYDLAVSKDAMLSFRRKYCWSIDKWADQTNLTLAAGQSFLVNYSVKVDATYTDSNAQVSGNISVYNPAPIPATINSISDIVSPDIAATVNCSVSFPYTLAPGDTLNCTYSAPLPDTSSRINAATATLQNYSYDFLGARTPTGTTDFSATAGVVASGPTNQVDECITVSDTNSAGPQNVIVCANMAPKTFSYSQCIGPYQACGQYEVTNTASFLTNDTATTGSDSWTVYVNVPCQGCTLTPGYWKTHSKYGPAPYDDTWALVTPNGEDSTFFLSGQTWYQVLWTPPKGGNAYYILAHAYIAAALNQLNGASIPQNVLNVYNSATAVFSTYTPQQVAAFSKTQRAKLVKLYEILDAYNNGYIGPGHCDE